VSDVGLILFAIFVVFGVVIWLSESRNTPAVGPFLGVVALLLGAYGFAESGRKCALAIAESSGSLLATSIGAFGAGFTLVAGSFADDVYLGVAVVVVPFLVALGCGYVWGVRAWFAHEFAREIAT